MSEKLIIRNFAGIMELEIELSRINILIGPQAIGKSICAKLLYFCKSFPTDLSNSIENKLTKKEFDKNFLNKFEHYFPIVTWSKQVFLIRYELNDSFIEITNSVKKKSSLNLKYSELYKKVRTSNLKYYNSLLNKQSDEDQFEKKYKFLFQVQRRLIYMLRKSVGIPIGSQQLFIPAGRSFFSILQRSIFTFLSTNRALDPFMTEFGSFYESMKDYPQRLRISDEQKKLRSDIIEILENILCGKHLHEKGKDFILHLDGRRIGIANTSSGQQEMLPLAIILSVIPFRRFYLNGYSIYIEEPEAHLFPIAQKHIVELIALIFNKSIDNDLQFFITTHSPYILTIFNNLLQAGMIKKELKDKKLDKLYKYVNPDYILNPSDLKAYALDKDSCTCINCEDNGLISTNVIDSISNELAIQFDDLLSLEE
ncbi:AAA family ATPase [Bacteroidota bacterium]